VMHGPVGARDNHLWMVSGHRYAADLTKLGFSEVHVVSVRDDAKGEAWERAKEEFRHAVAGAAKRERKALLLPLLIASGGIEKGILERLEGLDFIWTGEALLPDKRIVDYLDSRVRLQLMP